MWLAEIRLDALGYVLYLFARHDMDIAHTLIVSPPAVARVRPNAHVGAGDGRSSKDLP